MERTRRTRTVETVEDPFTVGKGRFAWEPKEPVFNYEEDLSIDPNFLDAEFLNHSQVFMKYASESARTKKVASLAEEKVKVTRSQIILELKSSGEKYTESAIEANYRLDPRHIQAKEEQAQAEYEANLMENAVFAFQARKCALENLVRLYATSYNSGPSEPRDLPEAAKRLNDMKEHNTERLIKERLRGEK
jgi:hypothetical protein